MTEKEKKAIMNKLMKLDEELHAIVEALPHETFISPYGYIGISVDESVLRELTDDIEEEPWAEEGYSSLSHRVGEQVIIRAIHSPKEVCPF